MDNSSEYLESFISRLKISTQPRILSHKDTAELLYGKTDLSQRGYKQLRSILLRNSITIPTYDSIRLYCNDLDVGTIDLIHSDSSCPCMGIRTSLKETLQNIFSSKELYATMTFLEENKQNDLKDFLCKRNNEMYENFLPYKRTIFLRLTGDNFRT